jgi:Mg2+ and Co2+ transporter CorA
MHSTGGLSVNETPKQRLRRLLDRLKLDDETRREADRAIEEMPDEEAEAFIEHLDDLEKEVPGTIDEIIKDLNTHEIPDD